jgi:hypothetical protein
MDSGHNSNESRAESGHPKPFRVFLASPGDVTLECELAREAIIHISSERRFRGRIDIEIIAWDQPDVALEAGLTPQEAIAQGLPKPEDCDLAVIVLWSRIGTPLPADFELKADGTPYFSGTEWEYFNALKGYRSNRKPATTSPIWKDSLYPGLKAFTLQQAPIYFGRGPQIDQLLQQFSNPKVRFVAVVGVSGSGKSSLDTRSRGDFR